MRLDTKDNEAHISLGPISWNAGKKMRALPQQQKIKDALSKGEELVLESRTMQLLFLQTSLAVCMFQ